MAGGTAQELQRRIESDRYRVVRRIGSGGMGVVYEADDVERGERVALKTLRKVDGDSLYRFKSEFRALSDLSHPNLITLYELVATGEQWFFTMELLQGRDFMSWVRDQPAKQQLLETQSEMKSRVRSARATTAATEPIAQREADTVDGSGSDLVPAAQLSKPADPERVRAAAASLCSGLVALHDSGHLHRDVKPSNVMVEDDGRVVLLDFGIITELVHPDAVDVDYNTKGTPAYMAPEQATGEAAPAPAADWYSVGVMLFEALAGHRPFHGKASAVLAAKRLRDAPALSSLAIDVPVEMMELCDELLVRDPARRPSGPEVLARLGKNAAGRTPTVEEEPAAPFGRDEELGSLRRALEDVEGGAARTAFVSGLSGIGKTTLINHFVRETRNDHRAVVLRGRCYERETVPYKALDELVDSLSRHVLTRTEADAAQVLGSDPEALGRVFPVLRRIPIVEEAVHSAATLDDRGELQRRAFSALRDAFGELASERPLVLHIEDLQWGDVDSAPFLAQFLREQRVPILLVASYRSEDRDSSPLLQTLEGSREEGTEDVVVDIELGPLGLEQMQELATIELTRAGLAPERAEAIASEAGGSPYFLHELVRFESSDLAGHGSEPTLDDVIRARCALLSPAAQRVLRMVAIDGSRLTWRVAEAAAGVDAEDRKALIELRNEHFIRTSGFEPLDRVETYHDRVREAVVDALPIEEAKAVHLSLAEALEEHGDVEGEDLFRLARHYFAGEPADRWERVAELSFEAGRRAAAAYSYEQAVLYLEQAGEAAAHAGITLGADFDQLLGDACARTGHIERAVERMSRALLRAKTKVQRAELRLGIAKVHLGQLNSDTSAAEAAQGLTELGYPVPKSSALHLLRAVMHWLVTLLLNKIRTVPPVVDESVRRVLRIKTALLVHIGLAAYFQMNKLIQIQCMLRTYPIVSRLGPSREKAEWLSLSATVLAILGKRKPSLRLSSRAVQTSEDIRDPLAKTRTLQYSAHGRHFLGDTIEAERMMRECLETSGHWLENLDFLTAVADYSWNSLMRGNPARAWTWLDRALKRVALDGAKSPLTQGHTYRCYTGPVLAILGRRDEGARHLSEFLEHIEQTPNDRWRWAQWLAHSTLFHVLQDDLEEGAKRIEDFQRLGLSPKNVPLQIQHFYVAQARLALRQLERGETERVDLERALGQLRKTKHPTLTAHRHVIEARRALLEDRLPAAEAAAAEAMALAIATDNAWVKWEVNLVRARLAERGGHTDRAQEARAEAAAAAEGRGWFEGCIGVAPL